MPPALAALRAFFDMMDKDGRLDEIGNPPSRND
jgi:hypothetical protein